MGCLDDNVAVDFATGSLSGAQSAVVERHLASCRDCRTLVATLAPAPGERDRLLALAVEKLKPLGLAPCPRCRNDRFEADVVGLIAVLDPTDTSFALPPPRLPVVALACTQCGFVAFHSLRSLGVVP